MAFVLVTGCNGFIGRAAIRAFARNHQVIGLDDVAPRRVAPLQEFVPTDLADATSVQDALTHVAHGYGRRITAVIHLAAYYDFSGEPSPLYDEVNVLGTERLLHQLQSFQVEQFVFSSTMLVHAPTEPGVAIDESSPIDPRWDYPRSKWQAEEILRKSGARFRPVILRIAGVYDDGCHNPVLAHQIQRIFERRLVSRFFPGDPSHGQAFVHLDDLVDVFERVLARRDLLDACETLLIGEPETPSYDEIQRTLGRLLHGEEWTTTPLSKTIAKAGAWVGEHVPGEEPFIKPGMIEVADDHYELDVTRALRAFAATPVRTLRASLPRIVENLRADPLRFYRENELEMPGWLERELQGSNAERSSHPG